MKSKIAVILVLISICSFAQVIGPKTVDLKLDQYSKIFYVAESGSDESGNGTNESPYKSIQFALSKLSGHSEKNRAAIIVAEGKYSGETIQLKEFVDMFGGFSASTWKRDIFANASIVSANSGERLFIGADNCTIDGFSIRNNQFRGKGAALFCDGTSPTITNNTFLRNKTLIPENWQPKYRHLIANDGGAIYCENGSSPTIKDNLFYDNSTECGRGAGIALHKNCSGIISGNVFMNNVVGLNDPERSSEGAVSVFDWSSPTIENNLFLNNSALAANDAGGLFVALWAAPKIIANIFVNNSATDDAGALFVGGQEHRYDSPLDPIPSKEKFFVEINRNLFVANTNSSRNSGAFRITMETRGSFTNNICVYNTGVYFQRSEMEIYNNTLLENFILIETKEGLEKSFVANNIIWGDLNIDAPAEFSNNNSRKEIIGKDNFSKDPLFIKDSFRIEPILTPFNNMNQTTSLLISNSIYKENELVGRVVKAGNKWSVIKSNKGNSIEVWGDLSGELEVFVLSSFQVDKDSPCIDSGKNIASVKTDYKGTARPIKGKTSLKHDVGAFEYKPISKGAK
ncbi:MAG: DUF1565 domain-containing protein [Ignavibacteria bacterium]|nr:DUF1565 domain-containing protein [Ignavibacteria bacterium]